MSSEFKANQSMYSHILDFESIRKKKTATPAIPPIGNKVIAPKFPPDPYEAEPGVKYFEDGSFEVSIFSENAKSVQLAGTGGSMPGTYEMEKGEDGYWRVTVRDVHPGFHYVQFIIDGVKTLNPCLPFGFGSFEALNYIEVPDTRFDFIDAKNVPHGSVRFELMYSESVQRVRSVVVYTPPKYDEEPEKRYPVLYCLPGGGENETAWVWQGKLNYMLDNLIASGKIEEMIAVCPGGVIAQEQPDGRYFDLDFNELFCTEIVPFIDGKFRTIADRESRAVFGVSLGGGQARGIVYGHTDLFANLGQFSSGGGFTVSGESLYGPFDYSELFSSAERYNSVMKHTFVTCGSDDPRHEFTSAQVKEFADRGYNIEYRSYPGHHEWDVWRFSMHHFIQKLFK